MARGVAILGMLYGHFYAISPEPKFTVPYINSFFWSFHMPLFAFVSGLFFKVEPMMKCITKSIKSLIFPLFIASCFTVLPPLIIRIIEGNESILAIKSFLAGIIYPAGYWFVIALFVCKLVMNTISILSRSNKYIYLLALVIGIASIYYPNKIEYFHLSRALYLLPYVIIGIHFQQYNLFEKLVNTKYISITGLVIIAVSPLFSIDIHSYRYPFGVFNIVSATIITTAVCILCKKSENFPYLIRFVKNIIQYCGKHSLMVLFWQCIIWQYHKYLPDMSSVTFQSTMMVLNISLTYVTCQLIAILRKRLSK